MSGFLRRRNGCFRAYQAIKGNLKACELPPGRLIDIKAIAESLAVSVTNVRKACHRLVEEGWVVRDKQGRYFSWDPAKAAQIDYYTSMETGPSGALTE